MRIYLADLGHNLLTKSSDVYPLGVANLATYATAYLKAKAPLNIEIFREPQDLKAAIDRESPDVLGLSNHAWNEELSASFAALAKTRSPKTLTVRRDDTRNAEAHRDKVATFGEHPVGLGKFTRTLFARDRRRSFASAAMDKVG
jgi:hypothetical protein